MDIYFEVNVWGWIWFFLGAGGMSLLIRLSPEGEAVEPDRPRLLASQDCAMHWKKSIGLQHHDEKQIDMACERIEECEIEVREILAGIWDEPETEKERKKESRPALDREKNTIDWNPEVQTAAEKRSGWKPGHGPKTKEQINQDYNELFPQKTTT